MKRAVKLGSLFLIVAIVFSLVQFTNTSVSFAKEDVQQRLKHAVVLFVDNPKAFVNNEETQIDVTNPKIKPVMKDNTVYIPVKFVAEALGAKVKTYTDSSAITITLGSRFFRMEKGMGSITVGKSTFKLEASVEEINGTLYAPVTSFARLLGKKVFYERGLIVLSSNAQIFDRFKERNLIDIVITMGDSLPVVGSYDNLKNLVASFQNNNGYYGRDVLTMDAAAPAAAPEANKAGSTGTEGGSGDHSGTNVQVEGVDEADIVKTDGQYIYQINGQRLIIARAYPAEKMEVVNDITVANFTPQEMYVYGKQLVVIGSSYEYFPDATTDTTTDTKVEQGSTGETTAVAPMLDMKIAPPYYGGYSRNTAKAIIYDITDPSSAKSIREIELDGYYVSSRMIGSNLYLLANKYMNIYYMGKNLDMVVPSYRDTAVKDDFVTIDFAQIKYFPDMVDTNYMVIAGIDLEKQKEAASISTYLGSGYNIYVSMNNLYIAATQYNYGGMPEIMPMVKTDTVAVSSNVSGPAEVAPSYGSGVSTAGSSGVAADSVTGSDVKPVDEPSAEPVEKPAISILPIMAPVYECNTLVYKFALNAGKAEFVAKGEVPGNILNQFSMDEYNQYFRIATTKGDSWRNDEYTSKNNVYTLDAKMNVVGKLEDLAPGEMIYSVRFMGERAYVVTFKTVDPLFVIDLKDPANPSVLGKLKIPGYSNYLQPYDENHIIGFGKDTVELSGLDWTGQDTTRAFYMGMKMAMFDVTDVNNPKEMFVETIGDRGTDSELLWNHKALLFSKSKNLLAFPVTVMEVKENSENTKEDAMYPEYGQFAFQGAYVYNVDLVNGFKLKAKITHISDEEYAKADMYWYDYNKSIQRILYIGDTLYTLSNAMIKAHALSDMKEINALKLPEPPNVYQPWVEEPQVWIEKGEGGVSTGEAGTIAPEVAPPPAKMPSLDGTRVENRASDDIQ